MSFAGVAGAHAARLAGRLQGLEGRELIAGASSAMALKIVGTITAFVLTLVVTRTLGPAAWGGFSLCLTVLTIATILGRAGVDTAALRLVASSMGPDRRLVIERVINRAVRLVLPLSLVVAVALYSASGWLASEVFSKPHLAGSFRLVSVSVPAVAIGYLSSQALRGLKRIKEYVFFDMVGRFLIALLLLPLALQIATGTEAVVGAFVAGAWILTAFNYVLLRRRVREVQPGEYASAKGIDASTRGLLAIGLPLLLASSITFLKGYIDTIMLGVFVSEAELGVYQVALKMAGLTSLPLLAINTIAAPKFAEAFSSGDTGRLERIVHQSGLMILVTSVPIAVVLGVAPGFWLGLFGPEMTAGVLVLCVLIVSSLVNAVAGSVGYLLQMVGRHVAYQNITLGVAIFSVVSNAVLIPRFGIAGAAVSTAAAMIIWNVACLLVVRQKLGFWTLPFAATRTLHPDTSGSTQPGTGDR